MTNTCFFDRVLLQIRQYVNRVVKAHRKFFLLWFMGMVHGGWFMGDGSWEMVHSSWRIKNSSGSLIWNVRSYKAGGKQMHHAGMNRYNT
ncbi:MAG TPA: hypothetical protein VG847_00105 [Chitinophagaceae bacterium]|nr:hypothetical protein [Chitinophagaceae bacterium]